jgi:prepilin-type N-terminal cleavage/methylation domain-containing protein
MDKGFSLIELAIALFILVLSVVFLVTLGINYLLILNSVKSRYLALNLAQEGIELAIALRNKQIETGSQPWVGVIESRTYCLSFNTSTKQINVFASTDPCPTTIPGYTRLISYSDFLNQTTNLTTATATKVISEVYFGRDKIQLDVVLTKWHPSQ